MRRQLDLGFAKATSVAFGVECRRESNDIVAGEPASYIDGGGRNQAGNPAILTPEKSTHFIGGVVITPIDALEVTVDF